MLYFYVILDFTYTYTVLSEPYFQWKSYIEGVQASQVGLQTLALLFFAKLKVSLEILIIVLFFL